MADLEKSRMKSELVYFIFPSCNGTCLHCWSANRLMGRFLPISWHERLMQELSFTCHEFSEIKLSGGEPFLHCDVGRFPKLIHKLINPSIPISIFTSGRPFMCWENSIQGVEKTYSTLKGTITDFNHLSIQLSVDEFHIYSLSEHFGWKKEDAEENTIAFISNFINACELIKNEYPLFRGPKLKIHCNKGRSEFHKKELFRWFPEYWWDDYAILTEGLIACGRGKELQGTVKLSDDGPLSHFLLPGVDFYNTPQTRRAVEYKTTDQKTLFLDDAPNSAVIMEGWWNLTNRIAKYEKIQLNHLCI